VINYGRDQDAPSVTRAAPLSPTKRGISYLKPGGIQAVGEGGEIRLQELRSRSSKREEPLCARKAVVERSRVPPILGAPLTNKPRRPFRAISPSTAASGPKPASLLTFHRVKSCSALLMAAGLNNRAGPKVRIAAIYLLFSAPRKSGDMISIYSPVFLPLWGAKLLKLVKTAFIFGAGLRHGVLYV
jgi:hypothetical protein